jgi:hypothetical protein
MLATILGLVYYISKSDDIDVEPFDDSALREQIRKLDSASTHWEQESAKWQHVADSLDNKNDSLEKFKPSIKYYYDQKYNFNHNATTHQLDSVIRSIW